MPFVFVSNKASSLSYGKRIGLPPFSYEWFCTKTCFETEAQSIWEKACQGGLIAGNSKGCGMSKHLRRKRVVSSHACDSWSFRVHARDPRVSVFLCLTYNFFLVLRVIIRTRQAGWKKSCEKVLLPFGIARSIPQGNGVLYRPYSKFIIGQACSFKMAGYWPLFIT